MPRKQAIEAAVAAHNVAARKPLLTPDATQLLVVMFTDADTCQRNLDSLVREGFNLRKLILLLRHLEGGRAPDKSAWVGAVIPIPTSCTCRHGGSR